MSKKLSKKEKQARYRARLKEKTLTELVLRDRIDRPAEPRYEPQMMAKVRFNCSHSGDFIEPIPQPGDFYYCYRCTDWMEIHSVYQYWRYRLVSRDNE